jgi:hypothetical protein
VVLVRPRWLEATWESRQILAQVHGWKDVLLMVRTLELMLAQLCGRDSVLLLAWISELLQGQNLMPLWLVACLVLVSALIPGRMHLQEFH